MKIVHLLNIDIPLTNEENQFMKEHEGKVRLGGLTERDLVLAQNLVRKGIYEISKDNEHIFKISNEKDSK